MVGDSTGHLQEKQGSRVEAEEKLGSSKQDTPSRGSSQRTTCGLATQVGGVATTALYCLSFMPELCKPMGPPVEGGATHQAKAVMSRAKKEEG